MRDADVVSYMIFVSLVVSRLHFHISLEYELVGDIKSILGKSGAVGIVRHARLTDRRSQLIFVTLVGCGQHFHISKEFELVGTIKSILAK